MKIRLIVVAAASVVAMGAFAGCSRPAPPPAVQAQLEQANTAQAPAPAVEAAPVVAPSRARPLAPVRRLTWVDAAANTDTVRAVRAERRRAELAGQTLMVYVGATWCEPCRYFHDAAVAGKLDEPLGNLRILAFDADRDREHLEPAGYTSKMIPLFVVPGPDGRAGSARLAGAIKGPEAVDYLVPRLRTLLSTATADLAVPPTPAAR